MIRARSIPVTAGWTLGLLAAGLLSWPRAGAEAAPSPGAPAYSLEMLAALALERNPALAADASEVKAAQASLRSARGERLPRVDAVGLVELFPRRERLLIFRHGFRGADNPFENAIGSYGLALTFPVYTSGRVQARIDLADAQAAAAAARASSSREELLFNLASAYYSALRLKELAEAQEATVASLRESLRRGELQRQVGRLAPVDLLRLRARLAEAQSARARLASARARALEVIGALAYLPPDEPFSLTGGLSAAPRPDIDTLRSGALERRPDLAVLRRQVAQRRAELAIAASRLGPSVTLKGTYRGVTGLESGITRDDASVLLEIRTPLFDGGVLQGRKAQAQAELSRARLRLRSAQRKALAELNQALADLAATEPRLIAAEEGLGQARESLRVEREKFAQGRGTSNDLLLAEEAVLKSRTNRTAVLADSQIAAARVRLAAGLPVISTSGAP